MIYLASPYSHPHPLIREWRFQRVCQVAAELMEREIVFCPIAHSHPVAVYGGAPHEDWKFWARQDLAILALCSKLIVCRMPGWRQSTGVTAEIEAAKQLAMPIDFTESIGLDFDLDVLESTTYNPT